MLTLSSGLGVDLAALGRTLGTATLLAMLQILDQSLSRMRTSGHAPLLAEMAVIRLATLEDLESVSAAVDRLASATAVAPPAPKKKTTELTAPAAEPSRSDSAAAAPPANVSPVEPVTDRGVGDEPASGGDEPRTDLPLDPLAAWQATATAVGGLAGDCATEATGATWRDGQLEITLPAQAATAAAVLRRPEVAAAVMRALETVAGRQIRHAIVLAEAAAEPAVATLVEQPRPTGVQTQAALLREAAEHPLVAHARTLFDAAIRKVEPPRPRESRPVQPVPAVATLAVGEGADSAADDDSGSGGDDDG